MTYIPDDLRPGCFSTRKNISSNICFHRSQLDRYLPDLREVAGVISGCAALPKEAAENKKLFTRLWVHEALRNCYDRLTLPPEMESVFNCIRGCVRSIFRENFDSAFEHLGKVDGMVRFPKILFITLYYRTH